MIRTKKPKAILGAALVIAVVLALVMPISAVVTNDEKSTDSCERMEIQGCIAKRPKDNTFAGESVLVTPYLGDDILPSITKDLDGHTVVTWTNEQSFSESFFGISYSDVPSDPNTWYDNGLVLIITGNDMYFDTALIQGPEPDDYKGLMGVWFSYSEETVGYYEIEDITSDFAEWPIYSWSSTAEDPYYAAISDGGYVHNWGEYGPYYFYVFVGDICSSGPVPSCPIFVFLADDGGSFYYDCQDYEQTAPAGAPDYVYLGTYYHTITYNIDTEKVIWKKVDPAVEPDYEYTPFQATIADGTNPKIAAYDTNVAVVFTDGGEVKCVYSDDDGENWETTTIATGSYPDICTVGTTMFATYINGGNLYLVTSTDDGATWGAAEQVNDVDGTVVADENSVDIHSAGIVWVDDRNEDYDIYYAPLAGPSVPTITGEVNGKAGDEYEYTFVSTDSTGSDLSYYIEWGDDEVEDWIGPYASGAEVKVSHTWDDQANYTVRAKAKNAEGIESDWGTLVVSMPVNMNKALFLRFLDHFPNAFPLLRYLLGL
jgi:hypothetical protein